MIRVLVILAILAAPLLWFVSCGDRPADALPPVPAQAEADRLGVLSEDEAVTAAGAEAEADEMARRSAAAVDPVEAARLQAAADVARLRAAVAAARADAARDLRQEALARAVGERAELQAMGERAAKAAAEVESLRALDRDRRWAGIGIGGCIAAAIALTICRLPPWIALGGPAAAAAGLFWVAAWSSVPWLAPAIGLSIACALLIAAALLAAYVVREWRRHADDLEIMERATADQRSIGRQPSWLRPVVSWLLGAA